MMTDARLRLIQTMAQLLQSQGYHHTGLNQIVELSGCPKGSLYHYFPGGKVDLAIAAIEHSSQALSAQLSERCRAHRDPAQGLKAVVDHFAQELAASDFSKGCPVATITLEQAAVNKPIQQACAAAYEQWQKGIAAYLHAHGVSDAMAQAEQFLAGVEGALTLARARHSVAPLRGLQRRMATFLQPRELNP